MATSQRLALFALLLCIALARLVPTLWGIQCCYVAAPLVMLFYNGSLTLCLWASLIAGLALDAIELTPRLGFLGLAYLLTAKLLYPIRLYFFKDGWSTLVVMTFLFSLVAEGVELLIGLFFDLKDPHMNLGTFLLMPMLDALFALALFVLPQVLWQQYRLKAKRRRYEDTT